MTRKATHQPRPAVDFTPVPVRARADGWTVARQRAFIDTLAVTGSLRSAAASVNMSEGGAIALRKRAGGESFSQAWDAAIAAASDRIREVMVDHALNGVPDPVFYEGKQVGERRRFNLRGQQYVVETGEKAKGRIDDPDRRDEYYATRVRIFETIQKIIYGACDTLQARIDTPEKRWAFNVLWGTDELYPFNGDIFPNFHNLAKIQAADMMIDGAVRTQNRRPVDEAAREFAFQGRFGCPSSCAADQAAVARAYEKAKLRSAELRAEEQQARPDADDVAA